MSLRERYQALRRRVFLEDVVVPLFKAEREIGHLQITSGALLLAVVLMGGVLRYRWTVVKAQTLRVGVERYMISTALSVAAYDRGIEQVRDLEYRIYNNRALPERERLGRFFTLDCMGLEMIANREAMKRAHDRAEVAHKALPHRLTDRTRWTDPLTGEAFPAGVSREEITASLVRRRLEGPEQKAFLHLMAVVSRHGAEALPTPIEILDSGK